VTAKTLEEKQAAVFSSSASDWRRHASVETPKEAFGLDRLTEDVKGAGILERLVIRLRLEPDLDGIKWILNILSNGSGNLVGSV
jgi:hypothetical protein